MQSIQYQLRPGQNLDAPPELRKALHYQWLRCDAEGKNCKVISHQVRRSYVVTEADVGHTIRVRMFFHNGSELSDHTPLVHAR